MRGRSRSHSSFVLVAAVAALLASGALLAWSLRTGNASLLVIAPVLITFSSIWLIRLLYIWQRPAAYRRRERRKNAHPAEALPIPERVKKPEQYDGGQTLHSAQWKYIEHAVKAQGEFFADGVLVAILPALALFLLSFQLLALPASQNWMDVGLILSEIACLIILIYIALTRREPTADWIENRVRTELFRREQYLFMAGIGPYLSCNSSGGAQQALRRKGEIESADRRALLILVPMEERSSGVTWLEALHHFSAKSHVRADLVDRMESYLYYRIGKQLVWFSNEIRDLDENDQLWTRLLAFSSLAAAIVAGFHAFFLYRAHLSRQAPEHSEIILGTLAIVLPPLAIACISIRSMYNFRGRMRTYGHEKNALHRYQSDLEALISEARQSVEGIRPNIELKFRAIALRTEQSLSHELEQWMLLIEKQEHELT